MKNLTFFLTGILCLMGILLLLLSNCNRRERTRKDQGISIAQAVDGSAGEGAVLAKAIYTRPGKVLLTAHPQHRLIPIYQEVQDHHRGRYISNNNYYLSGNASYDEYGRQITDMLSANYMPGLSAMYGQRLLNVAHYSIDSAGSRLFFEKQALINTLYFPALTPDTLQGKPVLRNYYLVSVYDQDTNQDSLINRQDLRRFYYFDLNGLNKNPIIPANYSVLSSQYDPPNDQMLIYARLDENSNGQQDSEEPIHIFVLPLKRPQMATKVYGD